MTNTLPSRLPIDVQSLLPRSNPYPKTASLPEVGSVAPPLLDENWTFAPHLVAFVRHCGCPFAEAEVKSLATVAKDNPKSNIHFVIVTHSEEEVAKEWFDRIGSKSFPADARLRLIPDPSFEHYAAWGIGQLPYSGMLNLDMVSELKKLASEGIKNTKTGEGSYRWQNSGGFAIDHGGIIRWEKLAKHAGDTCDYEEAVKTLL